MCPSGNVKVFSAGAAGSADGAGAAAGGAVVTAAAGGAVVTAGAGGAVVVAGAGGAVVGVVVGVAAGVAAAVSPVVDAGEAVALPGCDAQPARTRLTARPAIVTVVKNPVRLVPNLSPKYVLSRVNIPRDS